MLARLAHVIARHRWAVIGVWLVLTLFGAFAAATVGGPLVPSRSRSPATPPTRPTSARWRSSAPACARPSVVVFQHERAMRRRAPRSGPRWSGRRRRTRGAHELVLLDRQPAPTSRATGTRRSMQIYPPGEATSTAQDRRRRRPEQAAAAGLPAGISVNVTGRDPLVEAEQARRHRAARACCSRSLIGAVGALVILLFVFGTLPAVLIPLAIAIAAILNTFTLVWALTYVDRRLDHRPVPDRARRARRRDRLRAADDLPLPRRAARGPGRRDRARRDDDARGPRGDRLRVDRRDRPAVAASSCRCRSSARSASAGC